MEFAGGRKLAIQRDSDAVLETVTGGIRDLNNAYEITDLHAPNDPGKSYSAIERKAAGWAVMDADTRLSNSSAGARKGCQRRSTKVRFPASILPKALALEETSADSRTKGQTNPAARAATARRRTSKEVDARSVERSRIHHIGQSRVLSVPVNNSANSESVAALAAVLRDVLSPVGSPDSGRVVRLAALARNSCVRLHVIRPNSCPWS